MSRRNISITNSEVDIALERADNMSKFIERCVLEHLEREKVEYATVEDMDQLRAEFKIINQKYTQVKIILDDVIEMLFANKKSV